MDNKTQVIVVCGGKSTEHEVSLRSAASICAALDPQKYVVSVVGIGKTGKWLAGPSINNALRAQTPIGVLGGEETELTSLVSATSPYTTNKPPVVFPILHGPLGEDGTVQGVFELANCPYVGSGVLGSSLGMDKVKQKELLRASGIPVVPYVWCWHAQWQKDKKLVQDRMRKQLGKMFPLFVKPVNAGSSVGVTKVHTADELDAAMTTAFVFDTKAILEVGIEDVREIEVGVLGNYEPEVSVCGEILPSNEFYDYQAKYADETTQLIIPAVLSQKVTRQIKSYATQAFQALECWGLARVDFFYQEKTGKLYLNELNTMPGFTTVSMYPKLWEKSGVSYSELVDRLVILAQERFDERKKIQRSLSV